MVNRTSSLQPKRIVRSKELCDLLGISRTTAWRWERQGHLPPSRRIGPNVKGWCWEEIEAFLEETAPVLPEPSSPSSLGGGRQE
jgi:predicted DNA-binding transcriptional regulator AlpA